MTIETEKPRMSLEAEKVWQALSEKTKKAIQKDHSFRADRNNEIRQLRARGVKVRVLMEITGLSRNSILRITSDIGIGDNEISVLKEDLKLFQRATGLLGHHISKIEKK